MSVIVQIIATEPVHYSLDGAHLWEFAPGEFYEVSDRVANGMIARSWARQVSADELKQRG